VIIFSIDTLRADRLPVYGYDAIETPHIDRFAADSVVFERAYSHSPQTLPAHASILSGLLPFEHGVRFKIREGQHFLQHDLKSRGFQTAGFVSAYVLRDETRINQGFDHWNDELPPASPELSIGQVQRGGAETIDAALRWIDSQPSRRLFVFVHIYEPHKPYTPPPEFAAGQAYDGEVAYSDALAGRLFDGLRARRLYDPATIVLLSDHGEGLGDHGEQEHGLFLYDEAVRVPFIVKGPDAEGAGRRIAAPVQHIDIVPTILDLVRAPNPGGLRGRSLRAVLESSDGVVPEQGIYAEAFYSRLHFGWSELYSLTDARYRYIKAPREELYDLEQDPGEQRNLAAERQQSATAMRAAIERLTAGRPLEAPGAISAADEERFAALGYIGSTRAGTPADTAHLADPKDMRHVLEAYRAAVDLASEGRFGAAIAGLRAIITKEPGMVDVWQQMGSLLLRTGRAEEAVAAYRKVVELRPADPHGLISVAGALMRLHRLDDAREHAERAAKIAEAADPRARAAAHEAVVRVALAQRDRAAAVEHAAAAQNADASLPLPKFVEGRFLYDDGRYEEALAAFEAADVVVKGRTLQISELQFYMGDTLARLDRYTEAERRFRGELLVFPQNIRAYASLAMLYRASNRDQAAEQVIAELMRAAPTPEGYALAARLWTIFGDRRKADAIRTDARQRFRGDPSLAVVDRE
jgi:arylsulfatase A-like enzyme/Flp pilus assembly protein TadD